MSNKIWLRPGTPQDDNRVYLPEFIQFTDVVVNENGNNSQPYPERLQHFAWMLDEDGNLTNDSEKGLSGQWYEYVPESYNPANKTPLVVSLHGGMMTGWGQCIYSSWSMVADREGFICVFPNGHFSKFWQMQSVPGQKKFGSLDGFPSPEPSKTIEENADCEFLLRLIKYMQKKYNINVGRIYMQGMSNGSGMTQQFARYYGNLLAGAACSAGPGRIKGYIDSDRHLINRGGPVAVWESHPENNGFGNASMESEAKAVRESRYYWLTINQCNPVPAISIMGEHNMAFFSGAAPYVLDDIKIRDHGQTLDEAFLYWDYVFAGSYRDEDGLLHQGDTPLSREGDAQGAAVVPNVKKAWWHNQPVELNTAPIRWQKLKYHGLNGDQLVRGEYTCVPVQFLAKIAGAELRMSEDTLTAEMILPDGRRLQFARGSIGCVIDNRLRSMYCEALHREGTLLVSVEWFVRYILNWTSTECNGVTYVTDHFAELSYFMADLIKDLLNNRLLPETFIEEALKE